MYVSRLTFHTHPGKTHEVEQELQTLVAMEGVEASSVSTYDAGRTCGVHHKGLG
jgi:hypothetical protein